MSGKRIFRRAVSAVMAVLMSAAMVLPAFAEDSKVLYIDPQELFEFEPGSYYTDTDLFDGFKAVMPGDVLEEVIYVENQFYRPVQIWMGGLLHDEEGNPISEKVLEELIADDRKGELSELEYMHDFLAQLTLTVWKGEKKDKNIIYRGHPNSLDEGFNNRFVNLGTFAYTRGVTLYVELEVPATLGNEYANRIGEVDWIFVVVESGDTPWPTPEPEPSDKPWPTPPPGVEPTPEPTPTPGVEPTPTPTKPPKDPDSPQTGDNTLIWPFAALFAIGLIGMFISLFAKRKKDSGEE